MVEVLKQPPYSPVSVEKQVLIIYAGAKGYLDNVPVAQITKFEADLYPFIEAKYPKICETLISKKAIDADLEALLKQALEEFSNSFAM